MASKGAPKFSAKAAAAVRARAAGSTKGTFGKGTKSATSSNATRKPGAFSKVKPQGKGGGGGKQRRDGKGRFA